MSDDQLEKLLYGSANRCDKCGRTSTAIQEGARCAMPQPGGSLCEGIMRAAAPIAETKSACLIAAKSAFMRTPNAHLQEVQAKIVEAINAVE